MKVTKKYREIWNEAVRATLAEVAKYDGLIPDEEDRKRLCDRVMEKVAYKPCKEIHQNSFK